MRGRDYFTTALRNFSFILNPISVYTSADLTETMAQKTEAEIRAFLTDYIDQAGLRSKFFADNQKLDTLIKSGQQSLRDWRAWSTQIMQLFGLDVAAKYELEMLKLSLYDIHVHIGMSFLNCPKRFYILFLFFIRGS